MNDPKALELLAEAKQASACSPRLNPYIAKAEQNELQLSDVSADDAVWLLVVLKKSAYRDVLKQIAKGKAAFADIFSR